LRDPDITDIHRLATLLLDPEAERPIKLTPAMRAFTKAVLQYPPDVRDLELMVGIYCAVCDDSERRELYQDCTIYN
jgi:hypothetical protein